MEKDIVRSQSINSMTDAQFENIWAIVDDDGTDWVSRD
jgi:hypothetical protein